MSSSRQGVLPNCGCRPRHRIRSHGHRERRIPARDRREGGRRAGRGHRARAAPARPGRVRRPGEDPRAARRSSSRPPRKRGEALDHVLLFGPPGLGKTTLSHIIAHELGVNLRQTSGPVLERPGDLAALLTNLEPRDVLFIDEIHRLSPIVEEILYPALEDFQIDIMIGEGPAARSVKLDLPPFTLIGATTRAGHAHQSAARPLRHRRPPRVLQHRGADAHRHPLGVAAQHRDRGRRRARDRAPLARHAAHRQPAAAPRARLCGREGHRRDHAARSPTPRCRCSTSTLPAST